MEHVSDLYDLLAELVSYPGEGYADRLRRCRDLVADDIPEALTWLERFAEQFEPLTATAAEELFTRTFDLNPVCSLEVGWHLFGENYERGEFLVTMRGHLRRLGLLESTELPDHLSHVLRVLGRLPLAEADRLLSQSVLPALEKMLAGLARQENPFLFLLEAVRSVLLSPCAVAVPVGQPFQADVTCQARKPDLPLPCRR
jgi:nitrate reductase molybdenum cofactor assembly chaperone NarJ/NarW